MTEPKPNEAPQNWRGWTVPDFDAAIEVRRKKHAAALKRDDLSGAASHEAFIDRLLDGRLHVTATRRPSP
jgi:hypothetical protein